MGRRKATTGTTLRKVKAKRARLGANRQPAGDESGAARQSGVRSPWEQRFRELKAFRKEHGHCNVPRGYGANRSLAVWVTNLRAHKKQGRLAPERSRRLDKLGFCWSLHKRRFARRDWNAMVAALAEFNRRYCHCDVPRRWSENYELGARLHRVRSTRRTGKLDRRRCRELDRLGVVWEPARQRWQEMYTALVEYKRQHGDCNVPDNWPEDRTLANWVRGLRASRARNTLAESKIGQLDKIGFVWNCRSHHWELMYGILAGFEETHGHCRVSTHSKPHKRLANWVRIQRTKRRQGRLGAEEIRQLDALGFTWDVEQERWEAMFAALVEYKDSHGDCEVPFQWPQNAKLGHWVGTQQLRLRRGTLTDQQIQRLTAIGFRWKSRPKRQPRS